MPGMRWDPHREEVPGAYDQERCHRACLALCAEMSAPILTAQLDCQFPGRGDVEYV